MRFAKVPTKSRVLNESTGLMSASTLPYDKLSSMGHSKKLVLSSRNNNHHNKENFVTIQSSKDSTNHIFSK